MHFPALEQVSKILASLCSLYPYHLDTIASNGTYINGTSVCLAIIRADVVFPHPGGP